MNEVRVKPPSGIVAVIRTTDPAEAEVIAVGLAQAGIQSIEITLTTPNAVELIRHLRGELGISVGAGTVRDASAARVRIPMIPYTQSDVFGRGRRRPRSGRR